MCAFPSTRLRGVSDGVIPPTSARSSTLEPAQPSRRAHTVAISRFAPPGHGSLEIARCTVQPVVDELVEADLACVALGDRVRRDQPEAAACPEQRCDARR